MSKRKQKNQQHKARIKRRGLKPWDKERRQWELDAREREARKQQNLERFSRPKPPTKSKPGLKVTFIPSQRAKDIAAFLQAEHRMTAEKALAIAVSHIQAERLWKAHRTAEPPPIDREAEIARVTDDLYERKSLSLKGAYELAVQIVDRASSVPHGTS